MIETGLLDFCSRTKNNKLLGLRRANPDFPLDVGKSKNSFRFFPFRGILRTFREKAPSQ